jgi:gamma-butyrobetaine dioxygenase
MNAQSLEAVSSRTTANASKVAIIGVEMLGHRASVRWSNGQADVFHYIWLRDNCGCTECRHPFVGERLSDPASIPLNIAPHTIAEGNNGDDLVVTWPDGHVTNLTAHWLYSNAYGPNQRNRAQVPHTFWTAHQLANNLPEANFNEVMQSDEALLIWLRQLRAYGFTIVRDVPIDVNSAKNLALRINFLRNSNFGLEWDVRSVPKPDSLAYTSLKLTAHTDLVGRESQPGLQFLHCMVNGATGGESILVDGFAVAEQLRKEAPEHFETLTTVAASFRYQSDSTDVRTTFPIIRLDHRGHYFEVRYSNALMAPLECNEEKVLPFYAAYQHFSRLLRDPKFEFSFRLEAGDCEVFDNRRVMHGRQAFEPNSGPRHLQGCYVDTDDFLSRLRVLERTADFRLR